jgi:hypothetical protein
MPELPSEQPDDRTAQEIAIPVLGGSRRVLHQALGRKSAPWGIMYRAALQAIGRVDDPEGLHVAAYELRELMVALPKRLDVPMPAHNERMGDKVRALAERWTRTTARSACRNGDTWQGEIDEVLRVFLTGISEFFTWLTANNPRRKDEAAEALKRLDPTGRPLPRPLASIRVDEWNELLGYFNGVAHHNVTPDRDEFLRYVEALERFLLDHLEPRTFEAFDQIDQLLKRTES